MAIRPSDTVKTETVMKTNAQWITQELSFNEGH